MTNLRSVVLLTLIVGAPCFAQQENSGTPVTIEVSDRTGARIPHAQVTIMPEALPKTLDADKKGLVTRLLRNC